MFGAKKGGGVGRLYRSVCRVGRYVPPCPSLACANESGSDCDLRRMCSLSLSLSIVEDMLAVLIQVYAVRMARFMAIWLCAVVVGIEGSDCGCGVVLIRVYYVILRLVWGSMTAGSADLSS
jgi:hypothetical protein